MSSLALDGSLESLIQSRKGKGKGKGKGSKGFNSKGSKGKGFSKGFSKGVRKESEKRSSGKVSPEKLKEKVNMSLEELSAAEKGRKGKGLKGYGKGVWEVVREVREWSSGKRGEKGFGKRSPRGRGGVSEVLLQQKRRALLAKLRALEELQGLKGYGKGRREVLTEGRRERDSYEKRPEKPVYEKRPVRDDSERRLFERKERARREPSRSPRRLEKRRVETDRYRGDRDRVEIPKAITGFKGTGKLIKITNCPVGLNKNELRQAFGDVGTVNFVEVIPEKKTAFLVFEEARDAQEAEHQFDGGEINGATIKITTH